MSKGSIPARAAFIALALFALTAGSVLAQSAEIDGVAVTGLNRRLGQPVFNFGTLGLTGYASFGAKNPGGATALPITATTPGNAVLATFVDPVWFRITGLPESNVAGQLNVPLRRVPVIVDAFGGKAVLRDIRDGGINEFTRATSNGPITLNKWLNAEGTAEIDCNGAAPTVKIQLASLIPNGLYTIWAGFEASFQGAPFLGVGPLGGVPNVVATDARGRGTFQRVLNFCPLTPQAGQAKLLFIDVVYHSAQQTFGARPNLPRVELYEGLVTHSHLNFLVNGTEL